MVTIRDSYPRPSLNRTPARVLSRGRSSPQDLGALREHERLGRVASADRLHGDGMVPGMLVTLAQKGLGFDLVGLA